MVDRAEDVEFAPAGQSSVIEANEGVLLALDNAEDRAMDGSRPDAVCTSGPNLPTMTWWERLKSILKSEAQDVKEGMSKLGKTLDEELARKERELEATPAERVDMILEDIEGEGDVLDELEAKVRNQVAGTEGEVGPRRDSRVQILDAADVSSAPQLDAALNWVTVSDLDAGLRTGRLLEFDHDVTLDEQIGLVVGDERLETIAPTVKEHPLVLDAIHENREVLFVKAPSLHHEDVRLLVAAAFADAVPEDWKAQFDA